MIAVKHVVRFQKLLFGAMLFIAGTVFTVETVSADSTDLARKALPDHLLSQINVTPQASTADKLRIVNDYFNHLPGVTDKTQWQRADYWATPNELLGKGAGDCEDFALAKYFALVRIGVAQESLRLMYVERTLANGEREAHMVLLYQSDTESLVLDNIATKIQTLASRTDLHPVYLFDSNKLWLWSGASAPIYYGNPLQLSQWRDFLARI